MCLTLKCPRKPLGCIKGWILIFPFLFLAASCGLIPPVSDIPFPDKSATCYPWSICSIWCLQWIDFSVYISLTLILGSKVSLELVWQISETMKSCGYRCWNLPPDSPWWTGTFSSFVPCLWTLDCACPLHASVPHSQLIICSLTRGTPSSVIKKKTRT